MFKTLFLQMQLQQRIEAVSYLKQALKEPEFQAVKQMATAQNAWFVEPFIDFAVDSISSYYFDETALTNWIADYVYKIKENDNEKVGIVLAGNIPFVGLHDVICSFISGKKTVLKYSSKDAVLIEYLLSKMMDKFPSARSYFFQQNFLNDCDAYIATGTNNSARYFEYYFRNKKSIIRQNRNSVAILNGNESAEELTLLADDIMLYFGLGCRSVSKIFVPQKFDFATFLKAFSKYEWTKDVTKYRNNFDYNLSLSLLNKQYYMTNEMILLLENQQYASRIACVHYQYYNDIENLIPIFKNDESQLQCVISNMNLPTIATIPFGNSQQPSLSDYADNINTLDFLLH